MDDVVSARALMGLSLAFHIVFSTIAIGMPLMFLVAEGITLAGGDERYRQMARRWGRVALLLFAVGAVSGTILSFEFGLLWPTWMEFSGPIIGLPFALEAFAFFTEAIFLTLYIYGWDRLSPVAHWLCSIPVVISAAASAFFVISANAWMNQPQGFEVIDGRAVNVDPIAAMFNPAMPYEVSHGTLSAYVATGFAVAGVYAIAILRGDRSHYNRKAMLLGLIVGGIVIPLQILTGDLSARFLARQQPEKFAALEAQWETERGAPLRIGGWPSLEDRETRWAIELPRLGSLLAFHDPDAEIRGLNDFPADEIPDPRLVHPFFQIMVAIGFFYLFVAIWLAVHLLRLRRFDPGSLFLRVVAFGTPLGFIAIESGWFVTEFGRQPWIIWHLMRVDEAATPNPGVGLLFLLFTSVYVALAVGLVILLWREWRNWGRAGDESGASSVP